MAITNTELQALRDDAVRNMAAGIVGINYSDGRHIQYVSSPDQWITIIASIDSAIQIANAGQPSVRFTLPRFSRD